MNNCIEYSFFNRFRKWLSPPHPTYQSKKSRNRVLDFLSEEQVRSPDGRRLNVGSGTKRFDLKVYNMDLLFVGEMDIQGDLLNFPIKGESIDTIVCTGVLEHVSDPNKAVGEIYKALKFGGRVFLETPFMQTIHAAPQDFFRWTPEGLQRLMCAFDIKSVDIVAGPGSALAWQFQETMATLFSFNNKILHKIGLRIFGWLAVPLSWLDIILERNPMAWRAASGYSLVAVKPSRRDSR
jgi:SAM-dependent methyltransferase